MRVRRVFPDENNLTPSASCSEKRTVRRYIILSLKVRRDIQLVLSYDRRRPARCHVFVQQPALAIVPATESPSARGTHIGMGGGGGLRHTSRYTVLQRLVRGSRSWPPGRTARARRRSWRRSAWPGRRSCSSRARRPAPYGSAGMTGSRSP